jgi:hypothetical protein
MRVCGHTAENIFFELVEGSCGGIVNMYIFLGAAARDVRYVGRGNYFSSDESILALRAGVLEVVTWTTY